MMRVFKNNINVNEVTVQEYISIFIKTAVDYIQAFINNSVQLYVEANLYRFKGYSPVDYLKKNEDFAVLVNEVKLKDLTKEIAQNIIQLHSALETGSPKNPKVEISRQYNCNFEEEMQSEKNIISCIIRILESQDNMR
ncbi:940_t:CDS:2, partial [Dentiscutata heterogama]